MVTNAEKDFRNEANTFGFAVEMDPLAPHATPAKRRAMGRLAHEAAVCGLPKTGEPLAFYMGCDSRNAYIYKFVTAAVWDPRDVGGGMSAGDKYLSEGKLYAARFDASGQGEWLELSIANPYIAQHGAYKFANQGDVLVNARHAADAAGATRMDRPKWGAVNHRNGEICFSWTNNSAVNRTPAKVDPANPRVYMDLDGKKAAGNPNGHIIRFKESGSQATAVVFAWDIFLFGAEEDMGEATLRRFLVAPKGAEVTGITETADGRTLFVNIQHPGENSKPLATGLTHDSAWLGSQGCAPQGRPRSATIVITRQDGGLIGL